MSAVPATQNATTTTDLRRISEDDPDYQKLHTTTAARLTRSLQQYIREEQRGDQGADSRFINRHIKLMKQAYEAAHHEGQKDYWPAVSNRTVRHRFVTPDESQTQKRLTYYALGSVMKLAHQVKSYVAQSNAGTLSEWIAYTFDDLPAEYGNRVALQANITWTGLQDGYSGAGASDSATPYTEVWWNLGPVKTEHCIDCPSLAFGSPYDPPWASTGSNQLTQTPGDGQTDCGAACNCSLSYEFPSGEALNQLAGAIADTWNNWYPDGYTGATVDAVPPPSSGTTLTTEQKGALDRFRNASDRWNAVRGTLPEAPSMFAADEVTAGELPQWAQLNEAQQQAIQQMADAQTSWVSATTGEASQAEADIIQAAKDALANGGVSTYEDAISLGGPIQDYLHAQIGELADWAQEDYAIRANPADLNGDQMAWLRGDNSLHGGLSPQEVEVQYAQALRDQTVNLLSQMRDLDDTDLDVAGADERVAEAIVRVQNVLPKDWIEASNEQGDIYAAGPRRVQQGHGVYIHDRSSGDGTIAIKYDGRSDAQIYTDVAHELGHRFEDTVDGIWQMEQAFYNARTVDSDLVPLTNGVRLLTRRDNWSDAYVGRQPLLATRPGTDIPPFTSYEILSRGLEWVLGNDPLAPYFLERDPELHRFILGLLAGARDGGVAA